MMFYVIPYLCVVGILVGIEYRLIGAEKFLDNPGYFFGAVFFPVALPFYSCFKLGSVITDKIVKSVELRQLTQHKRNAELKAAEKEVDEALNGDDL